MAEPDEDVKSPIDEDATPAVDEPQYMDVAGSLADDPDRLMGFLEATDPQTPG